MRGVEPATGSATSVVQTNGHGTSSIPNTLIRASAGTGKTYQLSNRYLALLAAGHPAEQILAITFARKAAGEILDRILTRLAEAAEDSKQRDVLARCIGIANLDRAQCLSWLQTLARNLHRLRVGTLDSFFVQMALSHSLDLGLPPGWQILEDLDDTPLRLEALQQLLEQGSTADMLRLMHLLFQGESKRSLVDELDSLTGELHDLYCETTRGVWHQLPRPKPLADDEVRQAIDSLQGLPPFTNQHFVKAHAGSIALAQALNWEDFIAKGLPSKIVDGSYLFQRKPIDGDLKAVYEPLVDHARAMLLIKLANQTEGTHELLKHFDAAYQQLKLARAGLRFGDIPRLLSAGEAAGQTSDGGFRLDSRVTHLLLDEFQDTSLAQWKVLQSLARQCVSGGQGHSFFCVGDVKQAIYSWRGGVAEIFDAVVNEFPALEQSALIESYRSSQVVIDCVNTVFENLASNDSLQAFADVTQRWTARFQRHQTARDLPGYCRLITAPRAQEGGEKQTVVTLQAAAKRVAELARAAPGRSIGVLVRRNEAVARMIFELRRSPLHVLASEEGGNPLTDSVAVQLVRSLLLLADHPGDLTCRFHVATSPLGPAVDFKEHANTQAAEQLSARVRGDLLARGYGHTIYGWVRELSDYCGERDLARLMQLVELAYAYDARATVRPGNFVQLIDTKRVEDPASAQVRVMTVHQAKGLQFDFVVLPELDVDLKGKPRSVVIGRSSPTDPIDRVCRYASEDVQALLPPEFQKMFSEWPSGVVNESLCLLYVAMTRAVHHLEMIVAPAALNERSAPKKFSGVVCYGGATGTFYCYRNTCQGLISGICNSSCYCLRNGRCRKKQNKK